MSMGVLRADYTGLGLTDADLFLLSMDSSVPNTVPGLAPYLLPVLLRSLEDDAAFKRCCTLREEPGLSVPFVRFVYDCIVRNLVLFELVRPEPIPFC